MKFLDRFENARKVWELALPAIPMPPNETLIGWLAVYSDEEFEAAVIRVPHRLRQGSMGKGEVSHNYVHRLVSALLKSGRPQRRKPEEFSAAKLDGSRINRKEAECHGSV